MSGLVKFLASKATEFHSPLVTVGCGRNNGWLHTEAKSLGRECSCHFIFFSDTVSFNISALNQSRISNGGKEESFEASDDAPEV